MTATVDIAKLDAGKSPEQLCAERLQRAVDAIHLKQPDRIPLMIRFGSYLADLEGITRKELLWEPEKAFNALSHAALRYQPDFASGGQFGSPSTDKILGGVMQKWPGYGLSENQSYQFNEGEYMKAEDYDAFIENPGDWAVRVYLTRTYKELEGLAMLPNLALATRGIGQFTACAEIPQVASAFQKLADAATAQTAFAQQTRKNMGRMAALGFPMAPLFGLNAAAPFDLMSDTLRGMRGIFLDIRRCPDKLLAAEEKVIAMQVNDCIAASRATGLTSVFLALHRGSDGFISLPLFEKFYWPQLKAVLLGLIDAGLTPTIFWEGAWDQRLQYLAELPKGKTVGMFQQGDIFKIKEVLGDTMCIFGGMKVSMLAPGGATAEEVRDYTRQLCQKVGKGGGFIMSTDIGDLEGCDPEMIKVWVDATREFGIY